ncbi:MAG: hypothetical protein WCQ16_01790 [Verrucomicrobiae bacterium]
MAEERKNTNVRDVNSGQTQYSPKLPQIAPNYFRGGFRGSQNFLKAEFSRTASLMAIELVLQRWPTPLFSPCPRRKPTIPSKAEQKENFMSTADILRQEGEQRGEQRGQILAQQQASSRLWKSALIGFPMASARKFTHF